MQLWYEYDSVVYYTNASNDETEIQFLQINGR